MIPDLSKGVAVDAAHSEKNRKTEIQGVDLETGEIIFYKDIGNQTVNIGEFLAIVEGLKYIIRHNLPKILYSDSVTAIAWVKNKRTASAKKCKLMQMGEIYLKIAAHWTDRIQIVHWDNKLWGENPADFGNK